MNNVSTDHLDYLQRVNWLAGVTLPPGGPQRHSENNSAYQRHRPVAFGREARDWRTSNGMSKIGSCCHQKI